jgi:hypothetical protein
MEQTRNFIGVWELAFVRLGGFFLEFLTPCTLGAHNFLISDSFFKIVNVLDVQRGGVQISNTRNTGALPLDLACLECLNV